MPVLKIPTGNVQLSSSWRCDHHYSGGKPYYAFASANMPTVSSVSRTFAYSLPSGVKIKKSQIWATIGSAFTGYSLLNVNGNSFNQTSGSERGANITMSENSSSVSVSFRFKANGNKVDIKNHVSSVLLSNVYLWIEYENVASSVSNTSPKPTVSNESKFVVPPQSVAIYNQENGKIYYFDGVLKIQHTFSVKIEEEPEKHKDEFVNNARNEPDKLSIDVMMSDVYSDGGNMTIANGWDEDGQETAYNKVKDSIIRIKDVDGSWTRSGNAVYVLRRMKQARTKLSIITPHYVHVNMIIANITINQDDKTPFGWEGQIDFQHTFKTEEKKENNTSKSSNNSKSPPPSASIFAMITNGAKKGVGNAISAVRSAVGGIFGS